MGDQKERIETKVKIEILNNQNRVKINKKQAKEAALKFLGFLKRPRDCMLTLIFVTPYRIRQINKIYFKKNRITDVVAIDPGRFSKDAHNNYLGDIIVCPQRAKENSKRFGTSFKYEIFLYIAHGILHLLHYDDLKEKNRLRMQKKQQELMGLL